MAFKDLFIKSDEVEENVQSQPTQQNNNRKAVEPNAHSGSLAQQPSQPQQSISSQGSISADDAIVNKLWDKIIATNRPGPDYLELKNNVDALDDLPISNEQKLISGFKLLKKGYPSFQKEDITKAIDFYISVVNEEKEKGLKELENLINTNVNGVEDEIRSMQSKSEELKRQYDELQILIGEKTVELTKAKNDLDMKEKTFIGSIDAVIAVLNNDKENITRINF